MIRLIEIMPPIVNEGVCKARFVLVNPALVRSVTETGISVTVTADGRTVRGPICIITFADDKFIYVNGDMDRLEGSLK